MPHPSLNDLAQAMGINPAAPRVQNKIVYFFPQDIGAHMANNGLLQSMAQQLSFQENATFWVHYNEQRATYRVGQVVDIEDCRNILSSVFVHRADTQFPVIPFNQLPVLAAPIQLPVAPGAFLPVVPVTPTAPASQPAAPASPTAPTSHSAAPPAAISRPTGVKVPKPRNSWIIYRQDKHRYIADAHPEMHTSRISQVISKMWRSESAEVKAHYSKLAEEEKANHRTLYPGYKCSPRKSSRIKKRKTSKQEEHLAAAQIEVQLSAVVEKSQITEEDAHLAEGYTKSLVDLMTAGAYYPETQPFETGNLDFDLTASATAIAEYNQEHFAAEMDMIKSLLDLE